MVPYWISKCSSWEVCPDVQTIGKEGRAGQCASARLWAGLSSRAGTGSCRRPATLAGSSVDDSAAVDWVRGDTGADGSGATLCTSPRLLYRRRMVFFLRRVRIRDLRGYGRICQAARLPVEAPGYLL